MTLRLTVGLVILAAAAPARAAEAGGPDAGASDGAVPGAVSVDGAAPDAGAGDAAPPPAAPPVPPPQAAPSPRGHVAPQVDVVGRAPRALDRIPGSATVVAKEEIKQLAPLSANDVLRTVSGVNVVGEDPSGLRPNIGIRGLDPNRSRKVLILEDGVPVSLNPYGLPELYYAPPIERMERVEVVKGSGSILWGPQTIGGVINYITFDPPRKLTVRADLRYGSYHYLLAQASVGNTHGPIGYRVEVLHRRFDGPRALDLALTDVSGKFRLQLTPTSILGLKLNFYDETSRATYLGLTTPQFESNPAGNHALNDRFNIRRYALAANHTQLFGENLALQTVLYAYQTNRHWRRQDFDRKNEGGGYERVVPGRPGEAPTDDGSSLFFLPTTGNRIRSYEVAGLEPRLTWTYATPRLSGELVAGARFHYERAHDRFAVGAFPTASSGEILDEEIRQGYALALYVQNRFTILDKLRITPGLRVENFWSRKRILRQRTSEPGMPRGGKDVLIRGDAFDYGIIPGLGISYDPHAAVTLYAGVHRGYAPPRSKDAITPEGRDLALDAEASWNYEVGVRARFDRWLSADVAGFVLDFENQIIPPSEAGGAVVGDPDAILNGLTNSGRSRHAGLEATATFDLAALMRWRSFTLPLTATYTWVPLAAFVGGTYDAFRIPYAPEHLFYAQLRFQHRAGWSAMLGGNYVSSQFADKDNTVFPSRDGLVGLLPAYFLLDARVAYTIPRIGVTVYVAGKNLADQRYVANRAPSGIQPGMFRQIFGGVSWEW